MLFPEVDKVNYKINCREIVTCRLQFPTIMKIDTDGPLSFKKIISDKYPKFSTLDENKAFVFSSEDGKWKINLTSNYISLSTNNYKDWENFRERLQIILKKFVDHYQLKLFNIISLNSVYKFIPSKLGLNGVSWNNLVNAGVLGVLASEDMRDNIENVENICIIRLTNRNTVLKIGTKTTRMPKNEELSLIFDQDLSEIADRGLDQLTGALNHLSAGSSRMFRWGIKDQLHNAMKPEIIS